MPSPSREPAGVRGWRVGSLRGVPVYIGSSWPVVAAVITALFGMRLSGSLPGLGAQAYLIAALYAVLLLLSVLVHEAAHSIVGQTQGYSVQRIVADLWGGHTAYDQGGGSTPRASATVAVVGPLANAALAALGVLLLQLPLGVVPELLVLAFIWSNAFVAVFNLLPGLPLDGGFLVEALIWQVTGSRSSGSIVAGWCGRGVSVLVLLWAFGLPLRSGESPSLLTVAIAVFLAAFLWFGATTAIRSGQGRALLARVPVRSVAEPVALIEDSTPLADLPEGTVAVHGSGRGVWGLVDRAALAGVPAQARADVTVRAVAAAQPASWVLDLPDLEGDVLPVVVRVQEAGLDQVLVRVEGPAGHAALIRTDRLGQAIGRAQAG